MMCDDELVGVQTHLHDDLAQLWLKKHESRMMDVKELRKYWSIQVPKLFSPENGCNCLNIQYDETRIRNELFGPMERFLTGTNSSDTVFIKLKQIDDPPMLCGRVFKPGEPTYSCRDCGLDPTCVLCVDCFKDSSHKNHRYKMSMSSGGGYCDCGDKEAWKENAFCDIHIQGVLHEGSENNDPLKRLPSELMTVIERAKIVMRSAIQYCFEILTWTNNLHLPDDLNYNQENSEVETDAYVTMLYNDEVHTYEQVITTLCRAIDCDQKAALEYATTIDREGRSVVKCGIFTTCTQIKTIIERITSRHGSKPLRVDVMHTNILAHQTFAMRLLVWLKQILGHCEAFRCVFAEIMMSNEIIPDSDGGSPIQLSNIPLLERIMKSDTQFWKAMRTQWHQLFISGLLMDMKTKKEFAKMFTKNYGSLMKDFIADDHEHSYSITSLSVQLFTVPTLAHALIAEENAIVILLKTFTTECGRHRNHDGKLSFERNHNAMQAFRRAQYILYDLKYLFSVKPTEWTESLRKNFLHGISTFVELLIWMQGMDAVIRQVGQHVEFEAEWETGINLQLKLAPIQSLIIDWCSSERQVLIKTLRYTLKQLVDLIGNCQTNQWELCSHQANCIEYDVASMPVTIHLPLSRLVAGLILQLGKYDLNYTEPNFIVGKKPEPYELMELPLRTQVMIAQFRAGMWRRNGYSLVNQVYFYHNVRLRDEMYDRDILMLQIGCARLDPNEYLIHLLNKFSLLFWAQENYEGVNRKPEEDYVRQTISLVEEFLGMLLVIVSERFVPGLGKVSNEDRIKKEIIQWLSMEPMTHSELMKYLPKETHGYELSLEDIIKEIAQFKKASSATTGKYELKPEFYKDFNPFFYHYTRQDQSNAEEAQIKRKKMNHEELICCPPPVPPDFCPQFALISNIFTSDVMIHLLHIVLKRTSNLHAVSYSETQFEKVLHLIGVGLHEELKGTFNDVFFTDKCLEKGIYNSLEECLKCSRIDIHKDLCRWVLKKFVEVANLKSKDKMDVDSANLSQVKQEDSEKSKLMSDQKKTEEKRKAAAARKAKILAKIAEQQKSFIKENAEYFKETDDGISSAESFMDLSNEFNALHDPIAVGVNQRGKVVTNEVYTCILCREEQDVTLNKKCLVLSALVQRSTVLSKNRDRKIPNDGDNIDPLFVPSDLYFGPHISTCGHVMHSDCWQKFFETVMAKERRRPIRYGRHVSFDVDKSEFLCPLCECLSNCVIPIIPVPNGESNSNEGNSNSNSNETNLVISMPSWLTGLHAAVEKHHPVWMKDPIMNENGEKFICRFTPLSLDEVTKVLPAEEAQNFARLFNEENWIKLDQMEGFASLTEIMKLFSQSIFCVSLSVNPNIEDDRVPLLSYWACTYTIHSIERILRVENKSIFSDLSSRKYNCLQALVRYIGYSNVIFDNSILSSHCIRILRFLLINDYHMTNPYCCLDIDAFGTLVFLTILTPSLYPNQSKNAIMPKGNNSDQNYIQLLLVFHLVQIILTQEIEKNDEEAMETDVNQDKDDENDMTISNFFKDVLVAAGAPLVQDKLPRPSQITYLAKSSLLPFLRSSALFYHFLTNVSPPPKLKNPQSTLTVLEEFRILCKYLGLSPFLSSILDCSPLKQLALSWSRHPRINLICKKQLEIASPIELPAKMIIQSHTINQLIPLPNDYMELINGVAQFTCPNSDGDDSRSPTMCLVCGEILCSQSYCCQTDLDGTLVGACVNHAHICGAGVGIFLRIRDCKILLLAGKTKGCYLAPPYIDEYGETDQGLNRGNPLTLCQSSYDELHRLWLRHGIPEQIAHALELSSNLAATNWQLL